MSFELVELLKEVRATRDTLGTADQQRNLRIDKLESSINDIMRRIARPGYDGGTSFEPNNVVPARPPDFIIPYPAAALGTGTIWKSAGLVLLPALQFYVFCQNNAGATLGSGATTAQWLKAAPVAMQY